MNALEEMVKELNRDYGWFNEEELRNTPARIDKFYKELQKNQEFVFTKFKNPGYDELVILKDIDYYSLCAHHMLPFYGKVHIAYLPGRYICGISKLSRAVNKFASKPQLQEAMTQEIAKFIDKELQPRFVMVIVEGQHLCMLMRGVKQHNSKMMTNAIIGRDKKLNGNLKEEFLKSIKGGF